ncbi:DUF3611 family protein [Leptolyngbya sp. AN02str]|uniref:DUF3611 family protein n=1 Tax=Leptolyngbya sp. AN02str TaxID=3423363 RepID=UPI003D3160CE
MQTGVELEIKPNIHLQKVAAILRIAGWFSFIIQISLAAISGVLLLLAVSGRSFNQEIVDPPGTSSVGVPSTQATTPGLGIGIFWAVSGLVVLLFGIYLAFRLIRFSKRLRNPNPEIHPKRTKVMEVLKLAVMTGLVGLLLTIFGNGATIGVLLAKSVAQPQGVAIYDPNRIIRSLDVFAAAANTLGVTAHFVGLATALGILNWLHRPSDPI